MKKADIKAVAEIEWTNNHSNASNCCFEDIDPMPYDISEQEIIWQVDKLLL